MKQILGNKGHLGHKQDFVQIIHIYTFYQAGKVHIKYIAIEEKLLIMYIQKSL